MVFYRKMYLKKKLMWVDIIQYLEYGVYVFYLRYILINCIFGEQFII